MDELTVAVVNDEALAATQEDWDALLGDAGKGTISDTKIGTTPGDDD